MLALAPAALAFALPAPLPPLVRGADVVLVEEDLAGNVQRTPLGDEPLADLAAREATFFRFEGLDAPADLDPTSSAWAEVELAWGQRLRGLLEGGDAEDLLVRVSAGLVVPVPIDELRAVVLPARVAVEGGIELEAAQSGDRLYRRRAGGVDRIDGLVQGLSAEGVDFESDLGARTYPWSEVAALFVEPLSDEEPEGELFGVDLYGGSRLRGAIDELSAGGVRLRWGALERELDVPAELVLEIAHEDGRWISLSELPPSDLGPLGPFGDDLGMQWPPRMDRAQSMAPLRAGGRDWARGIGVHAPSRITWELGGEYASLRIAAAVDDEVRRAVRGGSVVFRIEVDGRLAYESPVARAGELLEVPPVDLAGASRLVLSVDPGPDSFVLDRASWLRPILVRG